MTYVRPLALFSLLALTACSSNTVKDTLGLGRAAPDEFRVVSRPPLSVPPQFSLRPPSNSDMPANQLSADQQAQSMIHGGAADAAVQPVKVTKGKKAAKQTATQAKTSAADSEFLKRAGADKADTNVRNTLVEERYSVQEAKEERSWYNFWSSSDEKNGVVDAKKEADRIKTNENNGKPVTEGDTPEIKSKDNGILNNLLGR